MKILIIHNRYLEKGGEDKVVDAELKLLEENNHKVVFYEKANEQIEKTFLDLKLADWQSRLDRHPADIFCLSTTFARDAEKSGKTSNSRKIRRRKFSPRRIFSPLSNQRVAYEIPCTSRGYRILCHPQSAKENRFEKDRASQ